MQVTSATFIPLLCSLSSEKFNEEPVKDELLGEIGVVYSYGPPHGSRLVTWPDLDRMAINQQLLRRQAHANLAARLGAVKVHGQAPSLMLSFDGIESSLLLADAFWDTLRDSVPGELVIGVPARDVVIVTGSESRPGLEKAKRAVDRVFFAGDEHLITRELLVRRGSGWEPLQRGAMAGRPIAVRRPGIPSQRPGPMTGPIAPVGPMGPMARPPMPTGPHPLVPAARMGGRPIGPDDTGARRMPPRPGYDPRREASMPMRRPDDTAARRALEDTGLRRALTDTGARRIIEARRSDMSRRSREELEMGRDGMRAGRRERDGERPGYGVDLGRRERPEPRHPRDESRNPAESLIGRRAGERAARAKEPEDYAESATGWRRGYGDEPPAPSERDRDRERTSRWAAANEDLPPIGRSPEEARRAAFRGPRGREDAQWWEVALRRYDPRGYEERRREPDREAEPTAEPKPKIARSWSLAEHSRALANRDGGDDRSGSRWGGREADDREPAPWSLRARTEFLRGGLPGPRTAFEG